MVDDILRVAERHLTKLNQRQRAKPARLRAGGRQDAMRRRQRYFLASRQTRRWVTCFPSAGTLRGATVMFSEVTEVRDAIHLLTPRAVNSVGKRLDEMAGTITTLIWENRRSANPSPAAKERRRTSWGKAAQALSLNRVNAIVEVLSPGTAPTKHLRPDLRRDARPLVRLHGTQQVASGITVQVFTPPDAARHYRADGSAGH